MKKIKYSDYEQKVFALLTIAPQSTDALRQQFYAGTREPYFARTTLSNALHSLRRKRRHNRDKPYLGYRPRTGQTPAAWWVEG